MRGFSRTWPTKGPRWANPTAPSRRSVNERRPSRRGRRPQRDDRQLEQDDHRAGGFADNLVDQFEWVTIGSDKRQTVFALIGDQDAWVLVSR